MCRRYPWKDRDNNTGCLQRQRKCMTVGRRETLFTLCPFIPSLFCIIKANFYIFPPLGYISLSLPCLFEETAHQEFLSAPPPQPPHQHHGLFSWLNGPKPLTPCSLCKLPARWVGRGGVSRSVANLALYFLPPSFCFHPTSKRVPTSTPALSTGLSQRRWEKRKPLEEEVASCFSWFEKHK